MTRVKVSLWILAVILAVCICSVIFVNRKTECLNQKLDMVLECVDSEKPEEAMVLAAELEDYCFSYCKTISMLVNSDKTTTIRGAVKRIKPLIEMESDEISAEIESIKGLLEQLYRSELPLIYNIF